MLERNPQARGRDRQRHHRPMHRRGKPADHKGPRHRRDEDCGGGAVTLGPKCHERQRGGDRCAGAIGDDAEAPAGHAPTLSLDRNADGCPVTVKAGGIARNIRKSGYSCVRSRTNIPKLANDENATMNIAQ